MPDRPPFRWILLIALAALGVFAACSGPSISVAGHGGKIYAAKCADCHGAKGEGVEGKYADALYGDWSKTKLTRYIAANMPEDKPETLTPTEAEAVTGYIYDAFYSPVAQVRLNPARVEIAHLTNQQYANIVADLLRQLSPADEAAAPGSRGLNAIYYSAANRGRFDATKIVHQGVDDTIDFSYAEGSQGRARFTAAEFSMQWRGAILADETGDYEFTIRTPNSVRVWINTEVIPGNAAEATLDVNVSTPEQPDHRVTVRLIGGRQYPIAIDYWALPGKAEAAPPPAIALRWKPPHGSERLVPARNLSPAKIRPTYVIGTRFPADDSSQGYERSISVSKAWDEATTSAAFEVANHVVKRIDRFAGTTPSDTARAQKVEALAEKFVTAAFRRPIAADERQRYVGAQFAAAADLETALRRVVLLTLKSPHFLYVELPGVAQGSSPASDKRQAGTPALRQANGHYTAAARLAFGLWDSAPDAALAQAAGANQLRTRAELTAQAQRMLGDPRARAKLREFFHHWLQIRFIEDMQKDAGLYPDFTSELVDDLRTSLNLFLDEVAWQERSDFRELLRADYVIANERLAKFYGLPVPPAGEFARVPAPAGERVGVLTHPYLLAALSYKTSSSPIHRGVFLTRSVVGRTLKSPPMAVAFNDAEFAPNLTMREKVTRLTNSDTCQGCHAVINPLGFSLEWYDAVGRYRREDNGRPIDAVSDYVVEDKQSVRFGGARDVAEFAIGNERANHAFIEQLFHHIVKQPVRAYGHDTLGRLRDSFIASGYNLQKLIVEIATVGALGAPGPALVAATPPRTSTP